MAGGILIQVLQVPAVQRVVMDNIARESENALENKGVYKAAVGAALNSMKPDKKE